MPTSFTAEEETLLRAMQFCVRKGYNPGTPGFTNALCRVLQWPIAKVQRVEQSANQKPAETYAAFLARTTSN